MESNVHTYQNDEIEVHYDAKRCIHAKECVKSLRAVFNPEKWPWIQPGEAPADAIARTVEQCPTGALQYHRKKETNDERPPAKNTISVVPDGPVYIRGDIEVQDHKGNVLLNDTRFALCRCGLSKNKPCCDNSHLEVNFEASSSINQDSLKQKNELAYSDDKLLLKLMKNGPVLVEGAYEIYSETSQPRLCSKNIALCRCGQSDNKPFCDGSHKKAGFKSNS